MAEVRGNKKGREEVILPENLKYLMPKVVHQVFFILKTLMSFLDNINVRIVTIKKMIYYLFICLNIKNI